MEYPFHLITYMDMFILVFVFSLKYNILNKYMAEYQRFQ